MTIFNPALLGFILFLSALAGRFSHANEEISDEQAQLDEITYNICSYEDQMGMASAELAREKEIAKASGVTSLAVRHNATGALLKLRDYQNRAKADYKATTGKKFDMKECHRE